MKPWIGINCELDEIPGKTQKAILDRRYVEAIERAGGIPILISPLQNVGKVEELLSRIDGLVLSGGDDIHPRRYGDRSVHPECTLLPKEKERFDLQLARKSMEKKVPILGICYGMQLLAVACGGSLHQHIPETLHGAGEHRKVDHRVQIDSGSALHRIVGRRSLSVHSSHHQAVREPGRGWSTVARAADGVIEAIERKGNGFLLGVQWHPEREPKTPSLFAALIAAARRQSR